MPIEYEVIVVENMQREWKVTVWANDIDNVFKKNDAGHLPGWEKGYILSGPTFTTQVKQISEVRTNNDVVVWRDGERIDN